MPEAQNHGFGEQIRTLKDAMEQNTRHAVDAADARHRETMHELKVVREALQGPVGKIGLVAKVDGHNKTLRWHNVVMILFLTAFITEVVNLAIGHAVK